MFAVLSPLLRANPVASGMAGGHAEPSEKRRVAFERAGAASEPDKDLLCDVLGGMGIAGELSQRGGVNEIDPAVDEIGECGLVVGGGKGIQQLRIGASHFADRRHRTEKSAKNATPRLAAKPSPWDVALGPPKAHARRANCGGTGDAYVGVKMPN
jgi:hypothetical protein